MFYGPPKGQWHHRAYYKFCCPGLVAPKGTSKQRSRNSQAFRRCSIAWLGSHISSDSSVVLPCFNLAPGSPRRNLLPLVCHWSPDHSLNHLLPPALVRFIFLLLQAVLHDSSLLLSRIFPSSQGSGVISTLIKTVYLNSTQDHSETSCMTFFLRRLNKSLISLKM